MGAGDVIVAGLRGRGEYNQRVARLMGAVYGELEARVGENNQLVPVNQQQAKRIADLLADCRSHLPLPHCATLYALLPPHHHAHLPPHHHAHRPPSPQEALQLYELIH